MQVWLLVTVLLGAGFLGVEIYEFMHYTHEFGFTITSSALGSAFYTLVGTRSTRGVRAVVDQRAYDPECEKRAQPL